MTAPFFVAAPGMEKGAGGSAAAPFFVTGTGTEAGKTHILCALLRTARARGLNPAPLKPVHSGFDDPAASDSAQLLRAAGAEPSEDLIAAITPFRFRTALAPDKAARREGMTLMNAEVAAFCKTAARQASGPLFIEGAGGVMSPLADDALNLDLIRWLGARPILIGGAYLGAISHTLTAVAAMRASGAAPELVLINPYPAGPASPAEMIESLARFGCPAMLWDETDPGAVLDVLKL